MIFCFVVCCNADLYVFMSFFLLEVVVQMFVFLKIKNYVCDIN